MTKRDTCLSRHRAILRRLYLYLLRANLLKCTYLLTYLRANAAPPRLGSGTTFATRHAPDSNLGRRQCVTRNFSQSRSANLGAAGPAGSSTRFQLRKTSMEETELIHRAPDSNLGRRQCTTDLLTYLPPPGVTLRNEAQCNTKRAPPPDSNLGRRQWRRRTCHLGLRCATWRSVTPGERLLKTLIRSLSLFSAA